MIEKINNNFTKALILSVSLCLKDKDIFDHIEYIALLGSVSEKEEIENYSDLDILFIIKSDCYGKIDRNILGKLKKAHAKVSRKYKIQISFLTHTKFEFQNYVDFEYLYHYSLGKVYYGDAEKFKNIFKEIIKNRWSSSTRRKNLIFYNVIHARFNLFRKFVSTNEYNDKNHYKFLLKLFIDKILEIADWCLIYNNLFEENKISIIKAFQDRFPKIRHGQVLDIAYKYRKKWNSLNNEKDKKKIIYFLKIAMIFVDECSEHITKIHTRQT